MSGILTCSAASSALYSTWVFIEELGLLFDAGDGVSSSLQQKSRKVRHVFVSHADRDHLSGLLQLLQINAHDGQPIVHYPKDCGSFEALREFTEQFNPHSGRASWVGIEDGEVISISDTMSVMCRHSDHVEFEGQTKALDFLLIESRRSLRPKFRGLPGAEIAKTRAELGDDAVLETTTRRVLGYSGDSSTLHPDHWDGVKYLFHEATFLDPETARGKHACVPEVIESASQLDLETLVLFHFSPRYKDDEILESVRGSARRCGVKFPIFVILPTGVVRDVLRSEPVWSP